MSSPLERNPNMSQADLDYQALQRRTDRVHEDIGLGIKHKYPKINELYKEGHLMKSWKSRWFKLDFDTQTLSYYEYYRGNPKQLEEHKGEIKLGHHSQISLEEDHGDRRFIINVTGLKKGHTTATYLSCGSDFERNQWFDSLQEVAFGPLVHIPEIFRDPFRNETRLSIRYIMNLAPTPKSPDESSSSKKKPSSRLSTNPSPVIHNGTYVQPMVTNNEPLITYETDHHHMWQHTDLFTLICVDPDVPSRSSPAKGCFVQWMVCNIRNNDVKRGTSICHYFGPAPVIGSGVHRIFFFLFKQPTQFTHQKIGELKTYCGGRENVDLWKWIDKFNMGMPVAAEGFCSEWDESCSTNLYDLMLGSVGVTPTHRFTEKNAAGEHKGISDTCCGLERMLINYSTYHTIACPLTCCCSDVGKDELKEAADNESAINIAHSANDSCLARYGRFEVIDCFPDSLMFCPPSVDVNDIPVKTKAQLDQEYNYMETMRQQELVYAMRLQSEAEVSMCSRFDRHEQVECCDDFDYRHTAGDAWDEFWQKTQNLWNRFMGFRSIGCCAELDETVDGPKAISDAARAYRYYSDLHTKRVFSKVNRYHTVGCCTPFEEDEKAARAHEQWVEKRSPCGRFYRFEVIRGCVPMSQRLEDHFRMEALKRQEIEGMTVCEAFCEEDIIDGRPHYRTVNMCELCCHVRRIDSEGDEYIAGGYEEALKHAHAPDMGDAVVSGMSV